MAQTVKEVIDFLKDEYKIEGIRKSADFKETNRFWNEGRHNSRSNIGDLMKQINELRPNNKEEWYKHYLNPDKSLDKQDRGRDIEEINDVAERFKVTLEKNGLFLKDEDIRDYVYIRTMYETYQGYIREEKAIERLQRFVGDDYRIEKADRDTDTKYNIDVFAVEKDTNEKILGFQIKSTGFQGAYHGNKRKEVTKENQEGFSRYLQEEGVPSIFLFAEKNGKINDRVLDYVDYKLELAQQFHDFLKDDDCRAFDNLTDKEMDKIVDKINEVRSSGKGAEGEWKVFLNFEKALNRHIEKDERER